MKCFVKLSVFLLFCMSYPFHAAAQVNYYSADSIPDVYWSKPTKSLLEKVLLPEDEFLETPYLWIYTLSNILKEKLNGYDSVQVIRPEGMFVTNSDLPISIWQPEYPFDSVQIKDELANIKHDSLRFKTYSHITIHIDSNTKILDSLSNTFRITKKRDRIASIEGKQRVVTFKYSLFGRLKEVHFNEIGSPKQCPNKPNEEGCHGGSEGELRKVVFHYKHSRLEYFTQYIYYAWDEQYYILFLKYY